MLHGSTAAIHLAVTVNYGAFRCVATTPAQLTESDGISSLSTDRQTGITGFQP